MNGHFLYLCLFATAVGAVLGALLRARPWDALVLSVWITIGMIGSGLALSWLMYLVPR